MVASTAPTATLHSFPTRRSSDLDFLQKEVPRLSRMIREAGRRCEPWMIIPLDVCTTTRSFALRAAQLAGRIPYSRDVDGEDLWFALSSAAVKKGDVYRAVSHLEPRRDNPMLVSRDYPDGEIEGEISCHSTGSSSGRKEPPLAATP